MDSNQWDTPDFLAAQVLRAHEWRPLAGKCRYSEILRSKAEHPERLAEMLRRAGVLNDGAQ